MLIVADGVGFRVFVPPWLAGVFDSNLSYAIFFLTAVNAYLALITYYERWEYWCLLYMISE